MTKRAQADAVSSVRKVIHKMRVVKVEDFEECMAELESVLFAQLEKMGSMAEMVQQEAEKELVDAQARINAIVNKKQISERAAAEAEEKKKTQQETADKLLKDATTAVEAAESSIDDCTKQSDALREEIAKTEGENLDSAKLTTDAQELLSGIDHLVATATNSLSVQWKEIDLPKASLTQLQKEFQSLKKRLASCKENLSSIQSAVVEVKDLLVRKASACKRRSKQKAEFERFIEGGSSLLTLLGLKQLAEEVFGFQIADDKADQIFRKFRGDQDGVPFEAFHKVKAKVAIEKSCLAAREALRLEAEKRAAIEAKKSEFKEIVADVEKVVAEAEEAAKESDQSARSLTGRNAAKASAAATRVSLERAEALAETCKTAVEAAADQVLSVSSLEEEVDDERRADEEEVAAYRARLLAGLKERVERVKAILDNSGLLIGSAKVRLKRKECAESETLRAILHQALASHMDKSNLDLEALHTAIKGEHEQLSSDAFLAFIKQLPLETPITDDAGVKAFFRNVSGGKEEMTLEDLTTELLCCYMVSRPTMLGEDKALDSRSLRRLDEGQLLTALTVPCKDASGVTRMKARLLKSGMEGWVCVLGNKGSAFLDAFPKYMSCVRATPITRQADPSSEALRQLQKDELIEVLETPQEESNAVRVRITALGDGLTGWVALSNSKEDKDFLEPC